MISQPKVPFKRIPDSLSKGLVPFIKIVNDCNYSMKKNDSIYYNSGVHNQFFMYIDHFSSKAITKPLSLAGLW